MAVTPKPKLKARRGAGTSIVDSPDRRKKIHPSEAKPKPLTEQQKVLVQCIAAGESVTSASFRAGYTDSASFAYGFIKRPYVVAILEKERAEYAEANKFTKAKFMDMLQEAFDMAKMIGEPTTMVSAAREMGKACAFYEPERLEITDKTSEVVHRLSALSTGDLLKIMERNSKRKQLPLAERTDEEGKK